MPTSVGVNKLSVVHMQSGGVTQAFPDVCKTPAPPGPPIPIPYPNISQSQHASKTAQTVTADGMPICVRDSIFSLSNGDEPGVIGGIMSGMIMGIAEFVNFSFDVEVEGKGVPRALDLMLHNKKNTPPFPLVQPPVIGLYLDLSTERCLVCGADPEREAKEARGESSEGKKVTVSATDPRYSGRHWCDRFPDDADLNDLTPSFKEKFDAFLAMLGPALRKAKGQILINSVRRPKERSYLMHYAWRVATRKIAPSRVPPLEGVDIVWEHPTREESIAAAKDMVAGYKMAHPAALTSRHNVGCAVDASIYWKGDLWVTRKGETKPVLIKTDGSEVRYPKKLILTGRRDGNNSRLHAVAETYGVKKLVRDPPHWSEDGQ